MHSTCLETILNLLGDQGNAEDDVIGLTGCNWAAPRRGDTSRIAQAKEVL